MPGRTLPAVLVLACLAGHASAEPTPEGIEFFEKKVRPVLVEHCSKCHARTSKKIRGGLLLDSKAGFLKGGDSGPVVVPGSPEKSRLLSAIEYKDPEMQMPPKGQLPEAVRQNLAAWVRMGAPWPDDASPAGGPGVAGGFDLARRKREHWAWQPVRRPGLPEVRDRDWPRNPVDRFLLARLEKEQLTPAPDADRRTWIRRVSFDLVGLPPRPDEVEAFVHDESPRAFERVVDRLLASPHFGERWARHWLDLVRYAETRGHEFDYAAPNAYQYRDFVIRALNADVPYDRFVTEHLAGDLLDRPRRHPTEGFNESVLGTGFWFLGEEVHSPVDLRQDQADRFDNRIDVMTKTFLGLTVACARCHDHKFDAISARDYYALFGFLESSSYRLVRFDSLDTNRAVAHELALVRERQRPRVQRALAEAARPVVERLADYLLAARDGLFAGKRFDAAREARDRKLDAGLLEAWITLLPEAAKDPTDLLHPWARSCDPRAPAIWPDVILPAAEDLKRRDRQAAEALHGAEVVIDYTACRPEDWVQDEAGFGAGPARPGDIRFEKQSARLVERGAAEYDRTWDRLKLAPGAENEPGTVGQVIRAGRTLRTPSFVIKTGKVYYLLKGKGLAYAAVDDHVMIAGPLHGQLVTRFDNAAGFRWVVHDLAPYQGQRTRVEFSALEGSDLAVAMVVQAEKPPGPVERPDPRLSALLANADSPASLAAGYQRLFEESMARLAEGRIHDSPEAGYLARLGNWLIRRPELLAAGPWNEAVARWRAEEDQAAEGIRRTSRLALSLLDGNGVDEHVFKRGSPRVPGEQVPRRFLECLAGPRPLAANHGSGRLELARQMTDPALNPLVGRVMVNRLWHHLFGRGLVASVDNFGVLGEAPTHPELLDYLADRFVRDGWSVKRMIRLLVLSRTYRMSSRPTEADGADPRNLLLHKMRLRRLEGEAIRDAMLALSGRLDPMPFGPPVPIYLTQFLDGRGRPASGPLDGAGRRSLYLAVRRNFLSPLLLAFDTPSPFSTVGRRTVSNVPAQALILMNDPFVHQQAETWARRVLARPGTTRERVTAMYQDAFARPPGTEELDDCLEFLERQAGSERARRGEVAPWADLAHALFNVKEFIFVD